MRHHVQAYRLTNCFKQIFASPDDLLHDIRVTLSALADIEYSYEADCERIAQRSGPDTLKERLQAVREVRRQRERDPYARRLERLEHRLRLGLTSGL